MEPTTESGSRKPMGPIIGSIIIVLLIVLGGLYFWGERLNREEMLNQQTAPDAVVDDLKTQGTSDKVSSIEADVSATNLDDLDAGLKDIDAELNNL